MSRDLTPAESYAFWQQAEARGGESLLDSMESTLFTYAGETSPLYSKESMQNRREYPLLGGLYARRFDDLHKLLSQTEQGLGLLKKIEDELNTIIQTKTGSESSYVFQWFVGDLDPGFYECRENDRLFFEAIREEFEAMITLEKESVSDKESPKRSLDEQIQAAENIKHNSSTPGITLQKPHER